MPTKEAHRSRSMRFMPDFHVRRPADGRAVQIVNPADLTCLSTSCVFWSK